MRSSLLAGLCLLLVSGAAHAAAPEPTVVELDSGRIRGQTEAAVTTFSGIRYARPPVGPLRWKEPVRAEPWAGVADATKPGEQCTQTEAGKQVGAEDCLFVNVTVPAKRSGKRLPVMVWLHGGGFTTGSGAAYDARRLAAKGGVMVVTVNYRLGAFGYLGLPGLAGSGTFGLADQLEALRWTKRNAAAFGGDAGNVTLFGESAGGMSTCALLTSPAARGLADRAIIQSGSCMLEWVSGTYLPIPGMPTFTPYVPLKANHATGLEAARKLGCPAGRELQCLRDKPAAALMPVNESFSSSLAYGTPLLPGEPAEALRRGRFLKIPVLSGGTRDEGNGFVSGAAQAGFPVTAENYPQLMKGAFGKHAEAAMKKYPLSAYRSPALAWATVASDRAWACPTLWADREMAEHTRVYAYEFADEKAPNIGRVPAGFPPGAQHASELPYLFDLGGHPWDDFTGGQWRLADQMIAAWTSFARTGRPTGWPAFTGERAVSLKPADQGGLGPVDLDRAHRCGFWSGTLFWRETLG
ncbi:carboxylesterase/lipase family protein [Nonomuraea endophytica]|uniref:Carboxylic ester hydrolase n=1 Tax=Nonomuraea endophytica TaxID=714136 RepID=A0A7W8ADI0_9ACTN|nr:carboxylesterase family protein [Nonomuraea endophytica]MBB5083076.1 para-nitrobenzyl esterase [Nonomuraea endophytica]